ncbi:MAG: proteasome activator, partial [Acidimicrobiia bacterium]
GVPDEPQTDHTQSDETRPDGSRPDERRPDGTGPGAGAADAPVKAEVVDLAAPGAETEPSEQVTRPTKLIRIASMVRTMLEEVRRAPLDEEGRRRLRSIHERSLHELEGVLSPDLRQELSEVVLPFTTETPSDSELRLAQAQLVGWLEGLFHGIQASIFTQQASAQQQLEQMRQQRAIEMGGMATDRPGPGAYL